MNIKNVEFFIKEHSLASGKLVYSPWIKYEERGLLWGWNKMEHPICYQKGQYWDLGLLSGHHDLGYSCYKFPTYEEAKSFSDLYSKSLNAVLEEGLNNQIKSEKIIKQEDMKN